MKSHQELGRVPPGYRSPEEHECHLSSVPRGPVFSKSGVFTVTRSEIKAGGFWVRPFCLFVCPSVAHEISHTLNLWNLEGTRSIFRMILIDPNGPRQQRKVSHLFPVSSEEDGNLNQGLSIEDDGGHRVLINVFWWRSYGNYCGADDDCVDS